MTYSISPSPNTAGWNNTDITVTGIGTDPESGVVSIRCSGRSFAYSGRQQISFAWSTEGETTLTCVATNGVGATGTISFPVRLDKTPPVVNVSSPAAGSIVDLYQAAAASFACNDALSGVALCQGTSAAGQPIDTASLAVGSHTLSAR